MMFRNCDSNMPFANDSTKTKHNLWHNKIIPFITKIWRDCYYRYINGNPKSYALESSELTLFHRRRTGLLIHRLKLDSIDIWVCGEASRISAWLSSERQHETSHIKIQTNLHWGQHKSFSSEYPWFH